MLQVQLALVYPLRSGTILRFGSSLRTRMLELEPFAGTSRDSTLFITYDLEWKDGEDSDSL